MSADSEKIFFICTRCNKSLKLDQSFDIFSEEDICGFQLAKYDKDQNYTNENLETLPDRLYTDLRSAMMERSSDDGQMTTHNFTPVGSSFYTSNEEENCTMKKIMKNIDKVATVFDIISGNTDIEHPLCEDCTDYVLQTLDKEVSGLEDQGLKYREYYQSILTAETEGLKINELEKDISDMEKQIEETLKCLEETEAERLKVEAETEKLKLEEKQLRAVKEKQTCASYDLRLQLVKMEDEHTSVDQQLEQVEAEIKKIAKANVFNATFHIWHKGAFGTINGFRLGRLPEVNVEWSEISAAWGQCALLLNSMAKKLGLTFSKYKVVPFGNLSYILELKTMKKLDLHSKGTHRLFFSSSFDQGMVAFLECLDQFKNKINKINNFHLPYKMSQGKIEDASTGACYSIKTQINSEEQWTKACKFMLTNLKWGLAFTVSQFTTPVPDH